MSAEILNEHRRQLAHIQRNVHYQYSPGYKTGLSDVGAARVLITEIDHLKNILNMWPKTEHPADERGPCLCSHCEAVRATREALKE